MGESTCNKGTPPRALEVLRRALAIAEEVKSKPHIYQVHLELSKAYDLTGDTARSFLHYKDFHRVKEEVISNRANAKIKNLQTRHEVERAEKETEIARLRNVELREKNQQLEQLLEELRATQAQLVQSEKMAALGRLTAGIAHEINTPVGALKSHCDIVGRCVTKLEENLFSTSQDSRRLLGVLRENSQTAFEASERIATIVRSLKSFTRLDEAEFGRVNIHEGLESALALMQHEIGEGIRVVKDYDVLPVISGYPAEINQVFMTLLRNACQAIDGEGTVVVKTWSDGDHVFITIADTGRGMPPEQLEGLFDLRFTRKESRVRFGRVGERTRPPRSRTRCASSWTA